MSGEDRTPVELTGVKLGQYLISSMIARGGTAEVYKAYHPELDRHVVIKVLAQEYSQDPDWVRRFRREARLLGRLDHPRILSIYDAGEHEGRPYLVTKFVENAVTLREVLASGPPAPERAGRILGQVAEALQAAHESGVVHRDIKPSNVLVTPGDECLVFDFGLAKPFSRREMETAEGKIVGTPEYMSPEQCKGEKLDHRSDIYSLGVLAYELLTGRVPFSAATPVGVMMKHLTETLPPLGVDSRLTPAVYAVIARAMSRLPEARFDSARELGKALSLAAGQSATATLVLPSLAPTKSFWRRLALPSRPRMARAAAAGAAVFAAGVSLFWFFLAGSSETPRPPAAPHNNEAFTADTAQVLQSVEPPSEPGAAAPVPAGPPRQARARSQTPSELPPGSIVIECNVPAVVTLNGEFLGAAPGTFGSISPGRHSLSLDAGHGRTFLQQVWITAGSTTRIRHEFEEAKPQVAGPGPPLLGSPPPPAPVAAVSPPEKAPSRPEQPILWEGYLTDTYCKARGAVNNHWRCLERCLREGARPMFYSKGKLYYLRGLERVGGDRNRVVAFEGWLDRSTNTISVLEPPS